MTRSRALHTLPGNLPLYAARHAHGWNTQDELARAFGEFATRMGLRMEVSARQVRRWESARPPWPNPDYRRVLESMFGRPIAQLGFTDPAEDASLPPEVRDLLDDVGAQDGWWRAGPSDDTDHRLTALLAAERAAVSIRDYSAGMIPGLLQTRSYASALLRACAPAMPETEVELRAERRMRRLAQVGPHRDGTRSLWFICTEAAFTTPVGGTDVLLDQLEHILVVLVRRPDVRLQVIRESVGAHPGLVGLFALHDFGAQRLVYLEALTGGSWTARPTCLAHYALAYDHLQSAALSSDETVTLIGERITEMRMGFGGHRPMARE